MPGGARFVPRGAPLPAGPPGTAPTPHPLAGQLQAVGQSQPAGQPDRRAGHQHPGRAGRLGWHLGVAVAHQRRLDLGQHPEPDLRPFSLIASTEVDGDTVRTVGVIGPMRMHYSRAITLVDGTTQAVSRVLREAN